MMGEGGGGAILFLIFFLKLILFRQMKIFSIESAIFDLVS